jgi:hypothetical protein
MNKIDKGFLISIFLAAGTPALLLLGYLMAKVVGIF